MISYEELQPLVSENRPTGFYSDSLGIAPSLQPNGWPVNRNDPVHSVRPNQRH